MEVLENSRAIDLALKESAAVIECELGIRIDYKNPHCIRFMNHLKLLAGRASTGTAILDDESDFVKSIYTTYPREFVVSERIAKIIERLCDCKISKEEEAYLAVHLRRIHPKAEAWESVFDEADSIDYCDMDD